MDKKDYGCEEELLEEISEIEYDDYGDEDRDIFINEEDLLETEDEKYEIPEEDSNNNIHLGSDSGGVDPPTKEVVEDSKKLSVFDRVINIIKKIWSIIVSK